MKQKVLGVIPARLGSTRIPEKMLKDIGGKPLVVRTYERTKKARLLNDLIVATDSERIAQVLKPLGAKIIMTPPELPTGTDRVAAAVKLFKDFVPDIVVNVWGDEPLFPASAIDECVSLLLKDKELLVSGVGDLLEDENLIKEPSIVKVLTDLNNNVLLFSRAVIPFAHNKEFKVDNYHVIGVMAMRRDFLYKFLVLPRTPIELQEGVEQMRILENGYRMRIVKGKYGNLGVNTPSELEIVRSLINRSEGEDNGQS